MTGNSNYVGWNIPGCSFFHTDSVVWIPKQSDTTHMPMHSSIYAHTVTQPSAQALFSLFPVSHPTTLRGFLLLLAAWDKIQNERKYGCKLASVNCSFSLHILQQCLRQEFGWRDHNWDCISLFKIIFFLYIRLHLFIYLQNI